MTSSREPPPLVLILPWPLEAESCVQSSQTVRARVTTQQWPWSVKGPASTLTHRGLGGRGQSRGCLYLFLRAAVTKYHKGIPGGPVLRTPHTDC